MPRYGLSSDVENELPSFLQAWGIVPSSLEEMYCRYLELRAGGAGGLT